LLAALVVFYLVLLLPSLSGELHVDDPRVELEPSTVEPPTFPAVVRYVSALDGLEGQPCFGLLVESRDGVPVRVLNLNAIEPSLGEGFVEFSRAGGFALAEKVHPRAASDEYAPFIEQFSQDDLASTVLSPVDSSHAQLQRAERIVVGVGFNYAAHREEADGEDIDRLAFAKMVVPSGAYAALALGAPSSQTPGASVLGDYEVELGFVVMDDIDLSAPPTDRSKLLERVAFFNANDVTDRWPIIVEGDAGFTRGKSRPGYLPLGPWMIHGRHLDPATIAGGSTSLRLSLSVDETASGEQISGRQDSNSARMIRGPLQILGMLREIAAASRRLDWDGVERGIALERDGRLILPAGSIVLTGTPVGTAIEAPTLWDRARMIVRANFSVAQARKLFALHCARNRGPMGYLAPGDVVEASIQYLGTQRWRVEEAIQGRD
jgi:2-keto-4-pentenoate hydratase/2-oxohepta-3-ene-1,7-dioic acid hydratase in catechol pathway